RLKGEEPLAGLNGQVLRGASAIPIAVRAHAASDCPRRVRSCSGNAGATRHSPLSDLNNNTLALLDATQAQVCSYAYEPYGATAQAGASSNTLQYGGRENDNPGNGQGLYFNRARYYMPALGRFISQDPIGWASGQTNNYAYVGGDPINFNDPTGYEMAAAGASRRGGGGPRGGGPRNRGDRASGDDTLDDRLEQERGIREAQDRLRRAKVHEDEYLNPDERIQSTDKTTQNTDDKLKGVRTAADADEQARDPFSEQAEAELEDDLARLDDDALRTTLVYGTVGAVGGTVAAEAGIGATVLAAIEGLEFADLLLILAL
ncbi:MAG: RHS repeat-associated core domain-containing protein, partial [Kofleriaceae bacterium]